MIAFSQDVFSTLSRSSALPSEDVAGLLLGVIAEDECIVNKCIADSHLLESIKEGTVSTRCVTALKGYEKRLAGSLSIVGVYVSFDCTDVDFSCILKELNTERLLKQRHPLYIVDIRNMNEYRCIETVPFSFSLSLPLPLRFVDINESNAESFLSSFCQSTISRMLLQYDSELLAARATLPLDGNAKRWRFLLPRQKTTDCDGVCTVEVDFDLFLFKGETVEELKQHLTEICYRVCKQTLLFSLNSGCALSSCLLVPMIRSQLHYQWKKNVLFVDEEKSTLRFFHYDPNALPFYKQLLVAILIPLIIYLYGLFSAWSRRSS